MERLPDFSRSPELNVKSLEEFIAQEPILERAYALAEKAHAGQKRAEGTPYITHPLAVTRIMHTEWGIRIPEVLAPGLLHDVPEDTNITLDDIEKDFGRVVRSRVDGVTKLRSESGSKTDQDRETIKKIIHTNLIDPIVGLIKSADRLHNMRTMEFMPDFKRIAKSYETNIYAKMAESLGMWNVMKELEDLSLKYTAPADFEMYTNLLKNDSRTNELFIANMQSGLELMLKEIGVEAQVDTQINGLARLRHKMIREHRFDKINDVVSFRIVVDDSKGRDYARNDCYKVLGVIRERMGEMEDIARFDDFYSQATDNGYSAIQVTLDYPFIKGRESIEIAITTKTKEEFNNEGVVSLLRRGQTDLSEYALKLIFTPTGEVKFFKPAATGLDFAYSIEKYMGAQATGVLIDGIWHPVSTVLPNASMTEVEVGESRIAPSPEAINFVLKPARKMIESQLADQEDMKIINLGKEKIAEILAERGLFDLYDLIRYKKYTKRVTDMLRSLGCKRYVSNLYRMIGMGQLGIDEFKSALKTFHLNKEDLNLHSIRIEGNDVSNILGFMGETVAKYDGNIKPFINEPDEEDGKETFKTTFIVENLEEKDIEKLQNALLKNPAIKKVSIV